MASPWTTFFRKLKDLPDVLKWTAGVLGGIAAVFTSYSQLAATLDPLLKKYLDPLPSNLVIYVSPDPVTAKSYLSVLADNGFKTRYLHVNELEDLPSHKAGIVIVGTKNGRHKLKPSPALKSYLTSGKTKVLGMGWLGAELFSELETQPVLGGIAHGFDSSVRLDPNISPDIAAGLPSAQPLRLYDENVTATFNNVAVYDAGSLTLRGAEGIARHARERECQGQYWPVAKHGNYMLWGYGGADAFALSDAGKRLFVNLVKHAQTTSFDIADLNRRYFEAGTYKGSLGCNFLVSSYTFKVNQVGDITLRVTSREKLTLCLNGPGKVGYYARTDEVSPHMMYHVTAEDLARGDEWSASITYFGPTTAATRINFELELKYPPVRSANIALWSVVGIAGMGLFVFAMYRFVRTLGRKRSPHIYNRS